MTVEKKPYVKPSNSDEAIKMLKEIPTEMYSRIKGRGLGLIEKWFPKETKSVEQQNARDSFLLLLSGVSSSITRKVEDAIEVISIKGKK